MNSLSTSIFAHEDAEETAQEFCHEFGRVVSNSPGAVLIVQQQVRIILVPGFA